MRHEPPPILSGLQDEDAFIAMTQLGYFGVSFAVRYDGAVVPHAETTIAPIYGDRRFTGDQQAALNKWQPRITAVMDQLVRGQGVKPEPGRVYEVYREQGWGELS
jgi:hypothetical protein